MLTVHTIKPAPGSKYKVKRVGRGNASGHGTSSTRGGKGQTARSGGSSGLKILGMRRIMQQTPKLRGFNTLEIKPETVRVGSLELAFTGGEVVTVAVLKTKKLIRSAAQAAKIVGGGELTKKLNLEGIKVSESVKAQIEKVGGSIK